MWSDSVEDICKLKEDLERILERIKELYSMEFLTLCPLGKEHYKNMIIDSIDQAYLKLEETLNILRQNEGKRELKEFTLEELANFDGRNGKPAYVAVNGTVYDVTLIASWGGGSHFGVLAGKDVTEEYNKCHENENKLSKLEVVGKLKGSNL